MVTIKFSDYGSCLATRELGHELAYMAQRLFDVNEKVIFDFNGVQIVTLSFSDELFGTLILSNGLDGLKGKSHFINTSDVVKSVIGAAIGLNKTSPRAIIQKQLSNFQTTV